MVLTIATLDTAGKVDNWILGGADLRLSFLSGICSQFPVDFGRMRTHSDGDDDYGDSDGNGDGDGGGIVTVRGGST
jgi:hypothetical protein